MSGSESPAGATGATGASGASGASELIIEIVPFPEPIIDLTDPPHDVASGTEAPTADESLDDSGEPVPVEPAPVSMPFRRAADRPPEPGASRTGPTVAAPTAGVPRTRSDDDVALRSISVISRVVFVAMIGVIVAALIATVSVWAVSAATASTDDVSALSDAKRVVGHGDGYLRANRRLRRYIGACFEDGHRIVGRTPQRGRHHQDQQ